ncbi:MAG: hypothetical protein HDR71_15385 [Lachnospiraceae bacterium]|nr:hypothetical protein [Lachnospiraceae bacterium]
MRITVTPTQATFLALQKRLDDFGNGDFMKDAMRKAINEVADDTKNRLHSETRARYTIKASNFKKSDIKKKSATKNHLEATLKVVGPSLGVDKYKAQKNGKRKGAKSQVLKSNAMKELEIIANGKSYKAFMATMKNESKDGEISEHEGIFQRVPGARMKHNPQKEKIKEIMTLSSAHAAGVTYTQEISTDTEYDLNYNLLKHINAVIGA